ncbi:ABC transporter ATP-binding protein [Clostridium isatidis]|uniref:ATP-binding protein n=1 Tax=Clostridium isatidis TaxID=182773 RepID=A0A343JBI2_9CLOT|nr:ABC transporter ATP-binding protein [Clostridium isatidis]ASW42890.1 ATP-binding protein [Clostridium isatidis]NLZ34215.1 ABC transporter ATP-binding protein [Clostridiales bacterium]
MKKVLPFFKSYKKELILGPLFKLIEAILELFIPIVMIKIIDIGIPNNDINYIIRIGFILILLGLVGLTFALICQYYASIASQGIGANIRTALFEHINKLSYKEIDTIGTSTLITRLTNDITLIQNGIAMLIRLGTRSPFVIIGSTIMAFAINFQLALIFLITMPIISAILFLIMKKSVKIYKEIQKKLENISLITKENIEGVRAVKAFSKEKREIERFRKGNAAYSEENIKALKVSSLLNPLTSIVMNFAIVFILYFGANKVNLGISTQGEIIALINYITQISLALIVFSQLVITLTKGYTSLIRVSEILEVNPSLIENNNELSITSVDKRKPLIEFRNVYFTYNNSQEYSLKNISFKINKNETVGIIGGTASGKSTIINLLCRFYDTTKGEILINGINVKNYSFKELRNLISLVPQKSVLFSGTIRSNLELGNKNLNDKELKRVLDISMASDFVNKLEDKYDAKVLKGGKNFSGGQKQRLSIARALAKNSEILILDDSLSALDFSTDLQVRKKIKEEVKNKTIIMISQRASSLKNADKIIVLDNGEVKAIGTHDELLDTCYVYKEIYYSQSKN